MNIGDLIVLNNSQTTGYRNGEVGVITKIERVGELFNIYWIYMSDGNNVPMWDTEFEVLDGSRRLNNYN